MSGEPATYDIIFNDHFKSQLVTVRTNGSIVGHKKFEGQEYGHQKWHFISDGKGNTALQNEATKTYLGVNDQYQVLVPTLKEYYWKLVPKGSPLPGNYFETADGELTWFLPNDTDDTRIELKPVKEIQGKEDQEKAEWAWKKA